jgi:hypothetical protein
MAKNDASRFGTTGNGMSTYIKLNTGKVASGGCGYGTKQSLLSSKGGGDTASKGTIAETKQVGEHRATVGLKGLKG